MAIDRRTFALGLAAVLATTGAGRAPAIASALVAATVRRPDGGYAAVLYDLDTGLVESAALPARGHDVAINPVSREAVAFARRPGRFALAYARGDGRPPLAFSSPPGRHFYGHGVFSRSGRLLYTTENAIDTGAGRIGVWDVAAGYRRIGELPSHGLGPHDIALLSDGHTLVVANGGLVTHPDHGRRPLNLAAMQPSLVYLDRRTGDLAERHDLPPALARRSIRHLDLGADDTVVFGCQNMGEKDEWTDLVGFHRLGEPLSFLSGGPPLDRALRHYVSSVAVDRSGKIAGVTSSRGSRVALIDIERRALIAIRDVPDVSGIAADPAGQGLIVTAGGGEIASLDGAPPRRAPWAWDNHAASL